jgi:hypothetical protein
MRLKTIAAAAALLVVVAGTAEAGESLGHRALKKLFPGQFQAVVKGLVAIDIIAKRDGSLIGRMLSKTDTGRWSIQSGQLCILFETWMKGRPSCSQVVWDGQWYRASSVKFRKI